MAEFKRLTRPTFKDNTDALITEHQNTAMRKVITCVKNPEEKKVEYYICTPRMMHMGDGNSEREAFEMMLKNVTGRLKE